MKKEILINATSSEIRVGITEDRRLAELFLELPDRERHVGSIYFGRVEKVIQGMNAAFVDIGLEQHAFLHFSDAGNAGEDYSDLLTDDDDDETEGDGKKSSRKSAKSGRGSSKKGSGRSQKSTSKKSSSRKKSEKTDGEESGETGKKDEGKPSGKSTKRSSRKSTKSSKKSSSSKGKKGDGERKEQDGPTDEKKGEKKSGRGDNSRRSSKSRPDRGEKKKEGDQKKSPRGEDREKELTETSEKKPSRRGSRGSNRGSQKGEKDGNRSNRGKGGGSGRGERPGGRDDRGNKQRNEDQPEVNGNVLLPDPVEPPEINGNLIQPEEKSDRSRQNKGDRRGSSRRSGRGGRSKGTDRNRDERRDGNAPKKETDGKRSEGGRSEERSDERPNKSSSRRRGSSRKESPEKKENEQEKRDGRRRSEKTSPHEDAPASSSKKGSARKGSAKKSSSKKESSRKSGTRPDSRKKSADSGESASKKSSKKRRPSSKKSSKGGNDRPKEIDAKLPTFQTRRHGEVTIALERGQEILTQVTRESYASKGVKVSTKISLPGRFIVLMPLDPTIGISRKVLDVKERRRLRSIARKILPDGFGCIIRTVAQDKETTMLEEELRMLLERWRGIEEKLKDAKPPKHLYTDISVANSVMRDLFTSDVSRVTIDNKKLYEEIRDYVSWAAPTLAKKVEYYGGKEPIFQKFGVEKDLDRMMATKVWLNNGGYVIIEQTEAMMVFDVNSGRYAKEKEQELNALRINLESAREIARQIRLRDIGGLMVIDFIDLYEEKNRKKVYDEMKKEMAKDRAKSVVLPMTQFGIVQMTRQRIRQQLVQTMSEQCPTCKGKGIVPSKGTILRRIERWLSAFRSDTKEFRLTLNANPHMIEFLTEGDAMSRLTKLMLKHFVRVKVIPDETLDMEEFRFFSNRRQEDITDKYLEQ